MVDPQLQDTHQKIRIPLYGPEDPAPSSVLNKSPKMVNLIPMKYENDWILNKRNGIATTTRSFGGTTAVPKACIGFTQIDSCVILAIANDAVGITIYAWDTQNTFTAIGTIVGGLSTDIVHLTELNLSGTPYIGVVWNSVNASKAYYAATTAGAFTAASLTAITDVDFPTELGTPERLTGPMVQMNGTTYVMCTNGKIYNSDLNSISSWNSLGVIQAIAYPDKGIGLCRYKHHIIAIGADSIEFFNDIGNPSPASPLERTQQAFIKFGCISQLLYTNVDDTLYWVSASSSGNTALWKLDGYTPVKLSTPAQNVKIATYASYTYSSNFNVRLTCIYTNGTKNVVLNGIYDQAALGVTGWMAYCVDFNSWWVWSTQVTNSGATTADAPLSCTAGDAANSGAITNYILIYTLSPGSVSTWTPYTYVYKIDNQNGSDTHYTNIAISYSVYAQLIPVDFGNEARKFINRATVIYDIVGSLSIGLNYNHNYLDGTLVSRSIAVTSALPRAYFNRLGACRKPLFIISNTSTVSITIRALELDVTQGTH